MRRSVLLLFASLLGSLAAAFASPLLLQKDCTKGPEVWCQNLQTASNCKAVKHCRQNVWNKPTVKSIPCDLCKEVVTVAGKILKDNATEEEIYAYMSKACEFFPDQGLVSQCKELVDAYLPNILDMIKEELDNPEVVCSSLALCQSLQKHLAEKKLQEQLQSNKIPELDFSELASPFMMNLPLLLYPQDKPKQDALRNGEVCKDCVKLMADFQEAVRSNTSYVNSLIDHVMEECERLLPAFVDTCKSYVSQYSDIAVQVVMHMQEQQPQAICEFIGFCPSQKSVPLETLVPAKVISEVKAKAIEAIPLLRSIVQQLSLHQNIQGRGILIDQKTLIQNSLIHRESFSLCDACTIMVEEVASLLESNKTEEEIIYGMEKVCSLLPDEFRDQCKDFVDIYGKSIIDMLLEATDPKTVCVLLKCCTNNALPAAKIVPVQSEIGNLCDVCKMVVAYADKELAKNATAAEIEAFLERVCHFLPQSVSDQCVQFVDQYEPIVVQLLAEMMDPTFVCSKLGVCMETTQSLLGSELCVRGPGYWCKNMETASQCNAIDHCRRHVWN